MRDKLEEIKKKFSSELSEVNSSEMLEELEQAFFGRKNGKLTLLMKSMKDMGPEERKEAGALANEVKSEMIAAFAQKKSEIQARELVAALERSAIDVTEPKLPARAYGHLHPITQMQYEIEDFFASMGFMVADGPELESEYYTFEALNIPADHPARDMQDTFYIEGIPDTVMRTHTSSIQVRALEKYGAPLRVIVPGRCFRNEATDPRHEHTFYQLDGLVVGDDISFAHLKGMLEQFAGFMYGEGTEVRLRPKYYPFVEPGVNVEVSCFLCSGNGCRVCKRTGWLEVAGAGTVHPEVLRAGGVDPDAYSGFAFGFGLNRLVMLKYGIEDVRHFMSGDIRFLRQF